MESGEGNHSPHFKDSVREEFMAESDSLEDQEVELSQFGYLMLDIAHIITCLYKFSNAIRNPAPKDRLRKITLIDMSYIEDWDIKQVDKMLCPVDPQNDFRVAKYLSERLGKANTRRRQLLKYYETHHKEISKPVTSTMGDSSAGAPAKVLDLGRAATVYPEVKSQTTIPTTKVQADEIKQGEDCLSQISCATSTNHTMRIHVPPPPTQNAAFEDEPFECPYCFNIINIRSENDWKYVGNHSHHFYGMLNVILGGMYLRIFNPMSAHSPTALRQMNYIAASVSGSIMRYSSIGESGIVTTAQTLFHKKHYFKSI